MADPKGVDIPIDMTPQGSSKLLSTIGDIVKDLQTLKRTVKGIDDEGLDLDTSAFDDAVREMADRMNTAREELRAKLSTGEIDDDSYVKAINLLEDQRDEYIEMIGIRAKYHSDSVEQDADIIAGLEDQFAENENLIESFGELADQAGEVKEGVGGIWGAIKRGDPFAIIKKGPDFFGDLSESINNTGKGMMKFGGDMAKAGGPIGGSLGGALTSVGSKLAALGPHALVVAAAIAAVIAATVGVVVLLGKAEAKIKEFNKSLLEAASYSELMGAAFGMSASDAASSSYNLSDALSKVRMQMYDVRHMEEYKEALKGIGQQGVSIAKLANQVGGLKNALEGAHVYSELWGMDLGKMGEMVGNWTENLGKSVESTRASFSQINRDAIASGMSVNKFVGIIQRVSENLGTMTSRVEEVSAALRGFKKAGMSAKDAEKAVMDLTGALENMDQGQVRKLTASVIRNGMAQEVYNSAMDEAVKKANAATKGMNGVSGSLGQGTATFQEMMALTTDELKNLPPEAQRAIGEFKRLAGKDISRVMDLEELTRGAGFTVKMEAMIRHIPGLEKGFAGMDKASDEQLSMMSKTYGVNLQTLQNMRSSVAVIKMNKPNASDEEIRAELKEQTDQMEDQMKKDKENAARIEKAKLGGLDFLKKAWGVVEMLVSEIFSAIADLGLFDQLRAIMEVLTAVVKALVVPFQYVMSGLKSIFGPLYDLGEQGSLLSSVLGWLTTAIEVVGKVLKLALWPVVRTFKIVGAIVKAVIKPFTKLFGAAKDGASAWGKIFDALQAVYDAMDALIGPIFALFDLLSGDISFDQFIDGIISGLKNLAVKIGDYILTVLKELPVALFSGLWAIVKMIAKQWWAIATLPITAFIWVGKQLYKFFSNFVSNLTKPIDFVLGIFDKIQAWVKKIPIIGWLLSLIIDVLKLPYKALKAGLQALGALGKWIWDKATAPIKAGFEILTKLGKKIWDWITAPFRWLKKKISGFFKTISEGWKKAVGWLQGLPLIGGFFGGGGGGKEESSEGDEAQKDAAKAQEDAAADAKKKEEEQAARIEELTGMPKEAFLAMKRGEAAPEPPPPPPSAPEVAKEVTDNLQKPIEEGLEKAAPESAAAGPVSGGGLLDMLGLGSPFAAMLGKLLPPSLGTTAPTAPPASPMIDVMPAMPPSILDTLGGGLASLLGLGGPATSTTAGAAGDVASDSSVKNVTMTFNIENGDPEAIAAVVRKVLYEENLSDSS